MPGEGLILPEMKMIERCQCFWASLMTAGNDTLDWCERFGLERFLGDSPLAAKRLAGVGSCGKLVGVAGKLGDAASSGSSQGRVVIQSDVSNQPSHLEWRGM